MKRRILLVLGLTLCCLSLTFLGCGRAFAQTNTSKQALSLSQDGQWPDQSGCWDYNSFAFPGDHTTIDGHTVLISLWASPDCGTNWADIQVLDGTRLPIQAEVRKATDYDGGSQVQYGNPVTGSRDWSKMVYSPVDEAYACVISSDIPRGFQCGTPH